jgi:hypothetical protein
VLSPGCDRVKRSLASLTPFMALLRTEMLLEGVIAWESSIAGVAVAHFCDSAC